MKGVRKFSIFLLISVLLFCIGVQAKTIEDVNLLRSLLDRDLNENNQNDERKGFYDWITDEQSIEDEDYDDDYIGDDNQYNDPIDDGGASLSDDLPENEINNNDESPDDYNDDDTDNYDHDDYNEDEDDTNDGDLSDDLPENEIVYTNDEDDNEEVDDDGDKVMDAGNNENLDDDNSQSIEKEFLEGKRPFNFDENPDMSASDAIYQINLENGVTNSDDTYETDVKVDPSRVQEIAQWDHDNGITKRAAKFTNNREYRWPNRILKYKFERSGTNRYTHTLTEFMKAKAEFESKTCIRMVEAGSNDYHVRLIIDRGCYSYVGHVRGVSSQFSQSQDVSIGNGCNHKGIIVHELLHALGFWHEQSRYDRDEYIRLEWKNIQGGMRNNNFEKHSERDTKDLGVPYDYESVMHYGDYAFAIDRSLKTIVRKRGSGPLGQRNGLSPKDAQELNRFYECNGAAPPTTRPTTRPGPTTRPTRPTTRPTIAPPRRVFGSAVRVFIKSVGCRDPGVRDCSQAGSIIKVDDLEIPTKYIGATVVILDGKSGKVEDSRTEGLENMGRYLLKLKRGKLVLMAVKGRWRKMDRNFMRGLRKIGGNFRRAFYWESSYAIIGWTGPGKVSVTQEVYTNRGKGPSVIAKYISFPLI